MYDFYSGIAHNLYLFKLQVDTLLGSIKKMKLCNFDHKIDLKTGLREMVGESIADR